jgi:hypothetical protein
MLLLLPLSTLSETISFFFFLLSITNVPVCLFIFLMSCISIRPSAFYISISAPTYVCMSVCLSLL